MPEAENDISAQELIQVARAAGFPRVTKIQLARWHRFGLLTAPRRRWLGRAQGSESRYPSETAERVLAICALLRRRRNLDYVCEELWWNGFEVKQAYIRGQVYGATSWGVLDRRSINRTLKRHPQLTGTKRRFKKLLDAMEPDAMREAFTEASDDEIAHARDEIRQLASALGRDRPDYQPGRRMKVDPAHVWPFESLDGSQKMILLARWLSVRRILDVDRWYDTTILLATVAMKERTWSR